MKGQFIFLALFAVFCICLLVSLALSVAGFVVNVRSLLLFLIGCDLVLERVLFGF